MRTIAPPLVLAAAIAPASIRLRYGSLAEPAGAPCANPAGFAFANELRQARWTELMDSFLVGRGTSLKARPPALVLVLAHASRPPALALSPPGARSLLSFSCLRSAF